MKRLLVLSAALLWCSTVLAAGPSNDAERLTGDQALSHLQHLKIKNARVFAEAARQLEAKGYKPTDVVHVVRSTEQARSRVHTMAPGILRTQESITDSTGEITMWSWDDGDPNTWEGVVYIEDYSTGANGTFDTQVDISSSSYYTYWETTVSYTSGGGGCVDCKRYTSAPFGIDHKPVALLAAASRDAIMTNPDYELVQSGGRMRSFIYCVGGGCIGAAVSCIGAGPAWPSCFLWRCAGVIIGCGINALK